MPDSGRIAYATALAEGGRVRPAGSVGACGPLSEGLLLRLGESKGFKPTPPPTPLGLSLRHLFNVVQGWGEGIEGRQGTTTFQTPAKVSGWEVCLEAQPTPDKPRHAAVPEQEAEAASVGEGQR